MRISDWSSDVCSSDLTGFLPRPLVDPVSGQPGFKRTPASIAAVTPKWRGFLLLARELSETPRCLWATRVAVPSGVLWEIAGNGALRAIEVLLPTGERIDPQDAPPGTKRIAIIANGRLFGALLVPKTGALPPRAWLPPHLA